MNALSRLVIIFTLAITLTLATAPVASATSIAWAGYTYGWCIRMHGCTSGG